MNGLYPMIRRQRVPLILRDVRPGEAVPGSVPAEAVKAPPVTVVPVVAPEPAKRAKRVKQEARPGEHGEAANS